MNCRNIETSISGTIIKDEIIAKMYQFGVLNDNESAELEVDLPEMIPIKLKVSKEVEVKLLDHNGKKST